MKVGYQKIKSAKREYVTCDILHCETQALKEEQVE